jgi:hypothetical protein
MLASVWGDAQLPPPLVEELYAYFGWHWLAG